MAIVSTTSRGQVTLRKEIFQHVGSGPGKNWRSNCCRAASSGDARCRKGVASAISQDPERQDQRRKANHRRDGRGHRRSCRRRVPERRSAMKTIADTNVLLRFLLADDAEQYKLALDTMENSETVGGDEPCPL